MKTLLGVAALLVGIVGVVGPRFYPPPERGPYPLREPHKTGDYYLTPSEITCGAKERTNAQGRIKRAEGKFCEFEVNVLNDGDESQRLVDGEWWLYVGKRRFPARAREGKAFADLFPGSSDYGKLVFDIPAAATPTRLKMRAARGEDFLEYAVRSLTPSSRPDTTGSPGSTDTGTSKKSGRGLASGTKGGTQGTPPKGDDGAGETRIQTSTSQSPATPSPSAPSTPPNSIPSLMPQPTMAILEPREDDRIPSGYIARGTAFNVPPSHTIWLGSYDESGAFYPDQRVIPDQQGNWNGTVSPGDPEDVGKIFLVAIVVATAEADADFSACTDRGGSCGFSPTNKGSMPGPTVRVVRR